MTVARHRLSRREVAALTIVRDEALTPAEMEALQRRRERDRLRYQRPDRRARVIATVNKWRAENGDRLRAYKHEWGMRNRARIKSDQQLDAAITDTQDRLTALLAERDRRRVA